MNELWMRQLLRAEQQHLDDPNYPDDSMPRCARCGVKRCNHIELFLYKDEWVCFDCLGYGGLQPDQIDELPAYDECII